MTKKPAMKQRRRKKTSTPSVVKLVMAPQPNWLPIARAPFYFLPKFASPGAVWERELTIAVKEIESDCIVSFPERDYAEVALNNVRLSIDAGSGLFSIAPGFIEETALDLGIWGIFTTCEDRMSDVPADFLQKTATLIPTPEYAEPARRLLKLAESLWARMKPNFDAAMTAGKVTVMAQYRSLLDPFTPMFPHQTRYFDFAAGQRSTDGRRLPPTGRGQDGEIVFNPHVVPPKANAPKVSGSIDDADYVNWLIAAKTAEPNLTKQDAHDRSKAIWGGPGDVKFRRIIWRMAREESPHLPWSTKGPKAKAVN